jgi:CheY-like chemotaxis protein
MSACRAGAASTSRANWPKRTFAYVGACHEAGAAEFLTKPFRDQELLDAIQLAIERDRTRSSATERPIGCGGMSRL